MEMSFLFQGPAAYGLYSIAPRSRLDLGFKRSFLKKKLDLNLNITDIFKGQRLKFETRINGNVNDFDQYFRSGNRAYPPLQFQQGTKSGCKKQE